MTPLTILVTGGLGFIGSHIVDDLVSAGHRVVVVDSLSPDAHQVDPDYRNPGADYRVLDVRDEDRLVGLCRGLDAVSHQAARVGLGVDFADVTGYVSDNDLGTATLLRSLYRAGFGGRLVQASSMVVYGEGGFVCAEHGRVRPPQRSRERLEAGRFDPECPMCGADLTPVAITEDEPLDPRNVYAATKVHQEHLGMCFANATGSSVVALRYHNVYGPRMPRDTPYAGVASIVRSACERGVRPRVFEDGHQLRDFVHVADVARANCLALVTDRVPSPAYNVASGRPTTVGAMAEAVCAGMAGGSTSPVVTGEFRVGDVRHVMADPDRAGRELGFRAAIDPLSGLREFAVAPLRGSMEPRGS